MLFLKFVYICEILDWCFVNIEGFCLFIVDGKTIEYFVISIVDKDIIDINGVGDVFVGGEKVFRLFLVGY